MLSTRALANATSSRALEASALSISMAWLSASLFEFEMDLTSESGTCDPLCSVDETSSQDFEDNYQPKTDFLKAVAIFAAAATGTVAINHSWVAANQDLAMALLFVIGYTGIIFEESLAFNKSGVGIIMDLLRNERAKTKDQIAVLANREKQKQKSLQGIASQNRFRLQSLLKIVSDTVTQVFTHAANAYYVGLINEKQKNELEKAQLEAVRLVERGNWSEATDARNNALSLLCSMTGLATLFDYCENMY
ncbi:hypothetical protein RYX36_004741 [Vicia faba]